MTYDPGNGGEILLVKDERPKIVADDDAPVGAFRVLRPLGAVVTTCDGSVVMTEIKLDGTSLQSGLVLNGVSFAEDPATAEVLSDPEALRAISDGLEDIRAGRTVSGEELRSARRKTA